MRFADKVEFLKQGKETYNEETGNFEKVEEVLGESLAHVNDMSREYQSMLFGGIRQGALTIRVKNRPVELFDVIRVTGGHFKSNKAYKVIDKRLLRGKTTYQVEEVI